MKTTDTVCGTMAYDPRDPWIGKSIEALGEYNRGESVAFQRYCNPGETVVDCGANIGATVASLSRIVGGTGKVIAFEPQSTAFSILEENIKLLGLTNVTPYRACVGHEQGTIKVQDTLAESGEVINSGALQALRGSEDGVETPIMTIDGLGLESCSFIKIDVEGAEPAVLIGAARTITKHRPVIYYEIHLDEHQILPALLASMGYRMFKHCPPLYREDNYRKAAHPWEGHNFCSINAIAIPKERNEEPPVELDHVFGEIHPSPYTRIEVRRVA